MGTLTEASQFLFLTPLLLAATGKLPLVLPASLLSSPVLTLLGAVVLLLDPTLLILNLNKIKPSLKVPTTSFTWLVPTIFQEARNPLKSNHLDQSLSLLITPSLRKTILIP